MFGPVRMFLISDIDDPFRLEPAYSLNGEGVPVVLMTGIPRHKADLLTQVCAFKNFS